MSTKIASNAKVSHMKYLNIKIYYNGPKPKKMP